MTGDSTDKGHKGWFEIAGFDFGVTQSGGAATGSGAGAGRVTFSPLTVDIDSLTGVAPLLADLTRNKALKSVELVGVTTQGDAETEQTVYDTKLTNASLTDVSNMPGAKGVETGLAFDFKSVALTDQGVTTEGTLGTPETTNVNAFHFAAPPAAMPNTVPQVPDGSASRYFLKVAGATGDSTDKDHKGWFAVDGFDFGATRSGNAAGAGSGAGAGKVTFSPLSVDIDSLTGLAPLLDDQNKGVGLKSVELVGVTSTDQTVYDLKLTNAVLFMVQNMASLTGSGGVETGLSFGFKTATLTDPGTTNTGFEQVTMAKT